MIMGDICTRRCPFCDVGHGRPKPLDVNEPETWPSPSPTCAKYVVITRSTATTCATAVPSTSSTASAIRKLSPNVSIETLVPDFRGRMDVALEITAAEPPDVFNHNLETVPRLYKAARPGSDYQWSLTLLQKFKQMMPHVRPSPA
jgi:lipoic acid synthetase